MSQRAPAFATLPQNPDVSMRGVQETPSFNADGTGYSDRSDHEDKR